MLRRMQIDLDATNVQRSTEGLVPYPDVSEVWSIREWSQFSLSNRTDRLVRRTELYKKESRIMNRLESQRGESSHFSFAARC